MTTRRSMTTVPLAAVLLALSPALAAQDVTRERDPSCDDWSGDRARYCEIREMTIPSRQRLEVDGGRNGGVSVEAWDRNEIRIRARVQAWADTEEEARDRVNGVRIVTEGAIRAEGESNRWAVSFEISVPRSTNLTLEAHNGGVEVAGVRGTMELHTTNGGLHLDRVGGDVRGETTNGGLHVVLSGSTWEGSGLNVRTTNGGVHLTVPEGYSARLETGTVNGGIQFGFPITVEGRISREITLDLGNGGPLIRAKTTNGGVVVRRPES